MSVPPFGFAEKGHRMQMRAILGSAVALLLAISATTSLDYLRLLGPECG